MKSTIVALSATLAVAMMLLSAVILMSVVPANATEAPTAGDGVILVVLDPPVNFDATARRLGFTLVSGDSMGDLGIMTKTVVSPAGKSKSESEEVLMEHFPDLILDGVEMSGFDL